MYNDGKSEEIFKEAWKKTINTIFEPQQPHYKGRNSVRNPRSKTAYAVAQGGIHFHGKGWIRNSKNLKIEKRYKSGGERGSGIYTKSDFFDFLKKRTEDSN